MKKGLFLICLVFLLVFSSTYTDNFIRVKANSNPIKEQFVTVVNDSVDLDTPVLSSAPSGENYRSSSRGWNGSPSPIVYGNRIYVAWHTGGTSEPQPANYCVIAVSEDGGNTWIDPFIIIDPVDESKNVAIPILFINGNGELWCNFAFIGNGYHTFQIIDNGGPLSEVTVTQPIKCASTGGYTKPTKLSNGSLMYPAQGGNYKRVPIMLSTDDGKNYTQISDAVSVLDAKMYSEAQIVEKKDGTLWMLSRIENGENGGVEQSFSYDNGNSWTTFESNLKKPLNGPGSRFYFGRLKSGNLVFVTNDNIGSGYSGRIKLTIYLSEDDGRTWPYSLLLNESMASYPDLTEDSKGNIYVAYDRGRYAENGIRISKITEADIKAGKIVSPNSKLNIPVTKLSGRDILEVKTSFENTKTIFVGTDKEDILSTLPKQITVRADDGEDYDLNGSWICYNYNKNVTKEYTFYFSTNYPNELTDTFGMLKCVVTVEEKPSNHRIVIIAIIASIAVIGIVLLLIFIIKNKKNRRKL